MQIGIQADTYNLENKLHLLAKEARVAPGQVIKEETRLLTQNIIRLTPPASNAQGRAAISQDLFGGRRVSSARYASIGLLQRIGSSTLVPPRNEATETVGVNLGWERAKKVRIMRKFWRPDATMAEVKAFHKRFQNPKTGRTGVVSRSTIGRWKVQDQLWVKDSVANKYLRELQKRVGWAKGAWVAALVAAGGRAPAWIDRHSSKSGFAIVNFGENPRVSATARNIKIQNYQRFVDNAVKNRERTTQKKIDALIAGRAVNLGFVTIAAR